MLVSTHVLTLPPLSVSPRSPKSKAEKNAPMSKKAKEAKRKAQKEKEAAKKAAASKK